MQRPNSTAMLSRVDGEVVLCVALVLLDTAKPNTWTASVAVFNNSTLLTAHLKYNARVR